MLAQDGAIQAANPDFTAPYEILEANRMAMTPKIDGKIEEEEWDVLGSAGSGKAMFQWEPGKLHIAAILPPGHDLLASFDLLSNGWLIGKDNLQIRVSTADGVAKISAGILDGTKTTGPTWVEIPGFAMSSSAAMGQDQGLNVIEATIVDPGLGLIPSEDSGALSLRMDAPPSDGPRLEPYLPRVCTPVKLGTQRSAALPSGLKFNTEGAGKPVAPGEWMRLRLTFNGNNNMNLSQLSMRSEGFAKDGTTKIEVPFPKFDAKGRAFVDYSTTVASTVPRGYKILRAELGTSDGINSFLETSYEVAEPVEMDLVRLNLPTAANDRTQTFAFYMRSNTSARMSGDITIEVPSPMRVVNGSTRKVNLSGRQRGRQSFELLIPANYAGTFPVKFTGTLGDKPYTETRYITVGAL